MPSLLGPTFGVAILPAMLCLLLSAMIIARVAVSISAAGVHRLASCVTTLLLWPRSSPKTPRSPTPESHASRQKQCKGATRRRGTSARNQTGKDGRGAKEEVRWAGAGVEYLCLGKSLGLEPGNFPGACSLPPITFRCCVSETLPPRSSDKHARPRCQIYPETKTNWISAAQVLSRMHYIRRSGSLNAVSIGVDTS